MKLGRTAFVFGWALTGATLSTAPAIDLAKVDTTEAPAIVWDKHWIEKGSPKVTFQGTWKVGGATGKPRYDGLDHLREHLKKGDPVRLDDYSIWIVAPDFSMIRYYFINEDEVD